MEYSITPLDAWINGKISNQGRLTRKVLEEYQFTKVQETLDWARGRSPFYQSHLQKAPLQLSNLSDLSRFPFTTSEDIRQHGLQFLCVSQDEIQRVVTLDTSGTTGQPKRLYFTKEDQELTIDFFQVGMSTFTAPGDKVLILLPCERSGSVGDLLAIALLRLGCQPIKHGIVQDPDEPLSVIENEKVNVVVGIPTQMLGLCRRGRKKKLKSVLLSTDHVPDSLKQALELEWGCQVYNHYGMTEMGLGGGVDCQAKRGYHLREADMFFEIVDPETGLPVPEGESGEVVFTTLTRRGMPLIRYRTGDISRFIPGECACGTCLKTLEPIRFRAAGKSPTGSSGKLTIADLDEVLFSLREVSNYTACLLHNSGMDTLKLEVYAAENAAPDLVHRINDSLDAIPVIHSGKAEKKLAVQIETSSESPFSLPPSKRNIQEMDAYN
jgi:phenylacetate-coenzyme A ligase PaaK-like adenylate-forming protein